MRSEGGKEDGHAAYVRAEWEKFHRDGTPLQKHAAAVIAAPRAVLDVGCGAGQELIPYLDGLAVGIDVRRSGLCMGRALFGARAPLLMVASAEHLPFATGSFDVVLCRVALPYMDVRRALAEMARVLAPGGALVLQPHHLRYYLREAGTGPLLQRIHALRVIARGVLFQLTGWQTGEVFQLVGDLRRRLDRLSVTVVRVDESDRGAPIVVARRR
ncbi:MAG TPA: class I SAM-dependent methyltransferase [Myxococcales bacterium]